MEEGAAEELLLLLHQEVRDLFGVICPQAHGLKSPQLLGRAGPVFEQKVVARRKPQNARVVADLLLLGEEGFRN